MANSWIAAPLNPPPPSQCCCPARTPGPLGFNDHADPGITSLLGDTPGPLGWLDLADVTIASPISIAGRPPTSGASVVRIDGVCFARGTGQSTPTADEVLTYPDTHFRYRRTTLPLADCLVTLPGELRADFKKAIEAIITQMHALGFALGVKNEHKAGYRTFQDQYDIPSGATRAGPGESFHNYLCAVDLGFLQWVDDTGKAHATDYWLGQMDGLTRYKGFSSQLWTKRNSFSDAVYHLSFEIIHLQSVPQETSGRTALVKCLNQAATQGQDANWSYRRSGKVYQCTLGGTGAKAWIDIGSAKQMWNQSATHCTAAQRTTIRKHMELAQVIAKTIKLD